MESLFNKVAGTLTQVFFCEYCGIFKSTFFIQHFWWLLLNFFTGSQKETVFLIKRSVMKTFKCSFPIDFAFNMSIRYSERTSQPEITFYSMDFLVVIISIFLVSLYAKKIKHTPLCFYSLFFVLKMFDLNFKSIILFYLNCKILFGLLSIKEKSFGL